MQTGFFSYSSLTVLVVVEGLSMVRVFALTQRRRRGRECLRVARQARGLGKKKLQKKLVNACGERCASPPNARCMRMLAECSVERF
jgi:hypothetical protein